MRNIYSQDTKARNRTSVMAAIMCGLDDVARIAVHCGLSQRRVWTHVKALEAEGLVVSTVENRSRKYRVA